MLVLVKWILEHVTVERMGVDVLYLKVRACQHDGPVVVPQQVADLRGLMLLVVSIMLVLM